jgi:hypothetical protein
MDEQQAGFAREVERVRASGLVGRAGRLRELFDFLAARGPDANPASQAEIAETVFGHGSADSDDATARVYIHRLRKRLEQFYEREGTASGRLVLPAGTYALDFRPAEIEALPEPRRRSRGWLIPLLLLVAVAGAFLAGRSLTGGSDESEANAIWQPFLESERPIIIAVGDYYIFGEIDLLRPEEGRLIRDFAIDSPTDLARAQEANPARYGATQDMGLNYLPFSSAYALQALMPVLAQHAQPVGIMPASQVTSGTFRDFNVIYVGLVSGMGLIEDVNFRASGFAVGESYDELIDVESGRRYVSGEARSLASGQYYRDYGYLARFEEPGGALLAVVAAERDTGLRGLAPLAVSPQLPERLIELAEDGAPFETLYEITGQQGADLNEKVVVARSRP